MRVKEMARERGGDSDATTAAPAGRPLDATVPMARESRFQRDFSKVPAQAEGDDTEDLDAGSDSTGGADGPEWSPNVDVQPSFTITRLPFRRSSKRRHPSTTTPQALTFTGHVAVDRAASRWRYQLTSIAAPVEQQIIYYMPDYYPAPIPTDDTGALSNVTAANWREVRDDLEANRVDVAHWWSSYRAEDDHENHHWQEWQTELPIEIANALPAINELGVKGLKSKEAAEAKLVRRVRNILGWVHDNAFETIHSRDIPGEGPAYLAQGDAFDRLVGRVDAYAAENGWD